MSQSETEWAEPVCKTQVSPSPPYRLFSTGFYALVRFKLSFNVFYRYFHTAF